MKDREITKQDLPHRWKRGSPPTLFVTLVSMEPGKGSVLTMWYLVGGPGGQQNVIKNLMLSKNTKILQPICLSCKQ